MANIHSLLCIVLTITFALQLHGQNNASDALSPADSSGFLAGMEVELTGEVPLGNILSSFSFHARPDQKAKILSVVSDFALNEYLTPATIDFLPADVRAKLIGDLKLGVEFAEASDQDVVEHSFKGGGTSSSLILPGEESKLTNSGAGLRVSEARRSTQKQGLGIEPGKVEVSNAGIPKTMERAEGSGLILPKGRGTPKAGDVSTNVPIDSPAARARASWQVVQKRWSELPRERKWQLIDIDRLDPMTRAVIAKTRIIETSQFRLKDEVSNVVRDLFGRLQFSFDITALEFRHRQALSDVEQVASDIELFSKLAGIRREMDNPNLPEDETKAFSLHFHMSKKGADNTRLASELNRLRLFQLAESGRAIAAFGNYGFTESLSSKGLIRLVANDRIEVRTHVDSPRSEIEKLKRLMQSGDIASVEQEFKRIESVLEARLRGAVSSRDPMAQSAFLALSRLKPESDALKLPGLDRLALEAYVNGGRPSTVSVKRWNFSDEAIADFSLCETFRCVRNRLRFINSEMARRGGSDGGLKLSDAVILGIEKDFARWKRLKDFRSSRLVETWSPNEVPPRIAQRIVALSIDDVSQETSSGGLPTTAAKLAEQLKKEIKEAKELPELLRGCTNARCIIDGLARARFLNKKVPFDSAAHLAREVGATINEQFSRWKAIGLRSSDLLMHAKSGPPEMVGEALFRLVSATPAGDMIAYDWMNWWELAKGASVDSSIRTAIEAKVIEAGPSTVDAGRLVKMAAPEDEVFVGKTVDIAFSKMKTAMDLTSGFEIAEALPSIPNSFRQASAQVVEKALAPSDVRIVLGLVKKMPWLSEGEIAPLARNLVRLYPELYPLRGEENAALARMSSLISQSDVEQLLARTWRGFQNIGPGAVAELVVGASRTDLLPFAHPHLTKEFLSAYEEITKRKIVVGDLRRLESHPKMLIEINNLKRLHPDHPGIRVLQSEFSKGPWAAASQYDEHGAIMRFYELADEIESPDPKINGPARAAFDKFFEIGLIEKLGWRTSQDVLHGILRKRIAMSDLSDTTRAKLVEITVDSMTGARRPLISQGVSAFDKVFRLDGFQPRPSSKLASEKRVSLSELLQGLASEDDAIYARSYSAMKDFSKANLSLELGDKFLPDPNDAKQVADFRVLMKAMKRGDLSNALRDGVSAGTPSRLAMAARMKAWLISQEGSARESFLRSVEQFALAAFAQNDPVKDERLQALWISRELPLESAAVHAEVLKITNAAAKVPDYLKASALPMVLQNREISSEQVLSVIRPSIAGESDNTKILRLKIAARYIESYPAVVAKLTEYEAERSPIVREIASRILKAAGQPGFVPVVSRAMAHPPTNLHALNASSLEVERPQTGHIVKAVDNLTTRCAEMFSRLFKR